MKKIPGIELSECIDCRGCVEICPEVFVPNEAGYIEIVELAGYPEAMVNEAIGFCPTQCISWLPR